MYGNRQYIIRTVVSEVSFIEGNHVKRLKKIKRFPLNKTTFDYKDDDINIYLS